MSVRIPNKLLFLRHPRTGSTATVQALITLGARKAGGLHDFTPAKGKEITVSTIRNPFDLLASWFALNEGWTDFEKFLVDYKHSAMLKDGRFHYFANVSDELFLYDQLSEDLNTLLTRLKLPKVRIYRLNTTSGKKPFEEYYTETAKQIVRDLYAWDLELYEGLKTQRTRTQSS